MLDGQIDFLVCCELFVFHVSAFVVDVQLRWDSCNVGVCLVDRSMLVEKC